MPAVVIETKSFSGESVVLVPRAQEEMHEFAIYLDTALAPGVVLSAVHHSGLYWTVRPWCDWEWVA